MVQQCCVLQHVNPSGLVQLMLCSPLFVSHFEVTFHVPRCNSLRASGGFAAFVIWISWFLTAAAADCTLFWWINLMLKIDKTHIFLERMASNLDKHAIWYLCRCHCDILDTLLTSRTVKSILFQFNSMRRISCQKNHVYVHWLINGKNILQDEDGEKVQGTPSACQIGSKLLNLVYRLLFLYKFVHFCEKLMCLEIIIHQQILCHTEQHFVCAWDNQAVYVF